ncbi:MAG: diguanylate cyclase, partial [Dehalococcoidia bacterium]
VYDGATGLHNRTYFIDRLTLECDRSERSGRGFSVLALHIRAMSSERDKDAGISEATMQRTAEVINSQTHPSDLVGHLSATELAILAIGVDREHRKKLLDRLREAVASDLSAAGKGTPKAVVTGGAATYGVDGEDPAALIQAARSAATMGSASARSNARSRDAA